MNTSVNKARAASGGRGVDWSMTTPSGRVPVRAARKRSASGRQAAKAGVGDRTLQQRVHDVALALGSRARLAGVLGVAASQPTRWIKGEETPNAANARAVVDLEHVVARTRLLWGDDETVRLWLDGRNAFLAGARPVDVVVTRGVAPVIEALDQEMAGAYA